ncbi:hypothetical protein QJS10_CPB20g00081 [Acorus calamus]|uniref:PRC-barrel domain-containing protein n=1 Tax=Acorus calamus TaxID=4465 RepID=A0AAV9CD42_ACOCL|nr:hypothetical protein QJS10_CPB20g00081 [Acorus calamus]
MRRSSLVAKQVISVRSACSLGFVSQLWVDASSWMVVVVEVRQSLLSGEMERFLLEDVSQVGDVVLVPDEGVMDNELKLVGLDTLEGYDVVTSSRRNVGKVRGYNFNINTGAVESLELDSFGSSLIPTSLVSTYCLFVEDVLKVVADTVIVHEGASSRVQRITKGFWDAQKAETPQDRFTEYPEYTNRGERSVRGRNNWSSRNQRSPLRRDFEDEDDWELPMDY